MLISNFQISIEKLLILPRIRKISLNEKIKLKDISTEKAQIMELSDKYFIRSP